MLGVLRENVPGSGEVARNFMEAAEDFISHVRELLFLSRNVCQEHEEAAALKLAVEERSARIRSNPQLCQPFAKVPQAEECSWTFPRRKDGVGKKPFQESLRTQYWTTSGIRNFLSTTKRSSKANTIA